MTFTEFRILIAELTLRLEAADRNSGSFAALASAVHFWFVFYSLSSSDRFGFSGNRAYGKLEQQLLVGLATQFFRRLAVLLTFKILQSVCSVLVLLFVLELFEIVLFSQFLPLGVQVVLP